VGLAPEPPAGHSSDLALERGASPLGLAVAWLERCHVRGTSPASFVAASTT
jgi:hypothetical protein